MSNNLSSNDKAVIALLRDEGALSIAQLTEKLGVTATAVRQRLNRLTASGLVTRADHHAGRGRPVHQYSLSDSGFKATGNNLADLATVLWEEVNRIQDEATRRQVINGVVERLSKKYRNEIAGETIDEKLRSIARLFAQKEIPFTAVERNGKVVLQIIGCPYPDLAGENHEICEMESQMISQLVDENVTVDREPCSSGGQCCKFQTSETQN